MERFLFVCTGNTCRSPIAEALLKEKRPDLQVKSAGVNALPGMDASEGSRQVLAEKGIEFQHSSSQVTEELMTWADIVLTLTENHKKTLIKQFPLFVDKIVTLKEYAFLDEIENIRKQLTSHYAQLELKQAKFIAENKGKIEKKLDSNEQLETLTENLNQLLMEDRKAIEQLEKKLMTIDISDPFGGSIELYRKTAKEIEEAIDQIIIKIDKNS